MADLHPDLTRLTIKKRKKGWGVYAMHNGISKALDGPRRKPNQLYDYISNWLKKAENVQHTEGMQITEPQSNAAGIWAISMLHAHIELSELNAIDVDGTICVTATHEDTMYTIERCYQSLDSAKRDLLLLLTRLMCVGKSVRMRESGS